MRAGTAKFIGSLAAVVILVVLCQVYWDIPVANYCKGLGGNIREFFQFITVFGVSTWYLIGSLAVFVFFRYLYHCPPLASRGLFLFLSILLSGVIVNIIKVVAGRFRPNMLFEQGLYGFNFFHINYEFHSFPSGHTGTTFSLASAFSIFFPKYRIPIFALALMVGVSRVVITSHYVSDVIAGGYIGIISVLWLAEKFSFGKEKKLTGFGSEG